MQGGSAGSACARAKCGQRPVWLGQENKNLKKVLEEIGHLQGGGRCGEIWQVHVVRWRNEAPVGW